MSDYALLHWPKIRAILPGARMRSMKPPEKSYALRGGVAILCGLTGVVGLIAGAVTYYKDVQVHRRAAEIAALPDSANADAGETALLQGRISKDVPVLDGGFVAYERRHHQKSGGRIERERQPLRVETRRGVVDIVNHDYDFDPLLVSWFHATRVQSTPTWSTGAVTLKGLLPGEDIMVVGRLTASGGFEAMSISAGPRDRYVEALFAQIDREWSVFWYWLLLAPFLLAYAVWDIRRVALEP